jgi:hypothetical protein
MPFVRGFLRIAKRRPGGGGPVDPDYGIDEGEPPEYPEGPDVEPPEPPPGIWPPLTPEHPWRPIPSLPERPSTGPVPPGRPPGAPDQGLPELPPGTVWPPLPPGVHGKFLALVLIGGGGHGVHYRYVVVDADSRPERPVRPDQGLPQPPTAQPKPG